MKLELICAWRSMLRLLRFLVLYAGAVVVLFGLLPMLASYLQSQYETMSGTVKAAGVVVFLLSIAAWQLRQWRNEHDRGRAARAAED